MDSRIRAGMFDCHRRVGERIAEAAFKEHPAGDASTATLAAIATLFYPQSDEFTVGLGGDEGDIVVGRMVIFRAMRARYFALCRTAGPSKELLAT